MQIKTTKSTKYKISRRGRKHKRNIKNTLKIQTGGDMDEKLKFLLDFFNVVDGNREYLVNAFSDVIELYSVVDWNASDQDKIRYIKSNSTINASTPLEIVNNNNAIRQNPKFYKINNLNANRVRYGKSQVVKTKQTNKSYSFIAKIRFPKEYRGYNIHPEQNTIPTFSLTLLKNNAMDEYLILASYGDFFNPYNAHFYQILVMLSNYLKDKILSSASASASKSKKDIKDIKILFFGHSMGAIIVQHLYLYFHRNMDFNNQNLFVIISSTGNTLTEEDNTYYNELVNGNFISYGFCAIFPLGNFEEKYKEYKIDDQTSQIQIDELINKLIIDIHLLNSKNKVEDVPLLTIKTMLIQIEFGEHSKITAITDLNKFRYFKDNIELYIQTISNIFWFELIHNLSTTRQLLLDLLHT